MRPIITALILSIAAVAPAFALSVERVVYTTADGISFHWATTPEGVIFVAPDDAPGDMYLMTPDCVATNQTHGKGSWGYDDDGWQISFGLAHQISFPRQTPPIGPSDCQMLR